MENQEIIDIARQAIWMVIQISFPVMMVGLTVGLTVALFQALTQIQEITLAFVPKIIAIFATVFALMPAMATTLINFMEFLADKMVSGGMQ